VHRSKGEISGEQKVFLDESENYGKTHFMDLPIPFPGLSAWDTFRAFFSVLPGVSQ
jgi:hypothetical protein